MGNTETHASGNSPPAEVRESEARASRIHSLLKLRDKAEAEISALLQEYLDAEGRSAWLAWCEREFGWKRRTAYRHLNPEQQAKHREEAKTERAHRGHIESATQKLGNPSIHPPLLDKRSDDEREPSSRDWIQVACGLVGEILDILQKNGGTPKLVAQAKALHDAILNSTPDPPTPKARKHKPDADVTPETLARRGIARENQRDAERAHQRVGVPQEFLEETGPKPKVEPEVEPTECAVPKLNGAVTISASERGKGKRKHVEYSVSWTEDDGSGFTQYGFRTLEEAMQFCPCSFNPDTVERTVIPGVTVHRPIPRGMCGHAGSYRVLDGAVVPGSEIPPNLYPCPSDEELAAEELETPTVEPEPAVKRGRGRPKGSKNRRKQNGVSPDPQGQAAVFGGRS